MRVALVPRAALLPLLAATVVASALVPALIATAPSAAAATDAPPGPANTGVPTGAKLTVVSGLVILDPAGKTYSNLEVALGKLKNQSTWLAGQLAGLS